MVSLCPAKCQMSRPRRRVDLGNLQKSCHGFSRSSLLIFLLWYLHRWWWTFPSDCSEDGQILMKSGCRVASMVFGRSPIVHHCLPPLPLLPVMLLLLIFLVARLYPLFLRVKIKCNKIKCKPLFYGILKGIRQKTMLNMKDMKVKRKKQCFIDMDVNKKNKKSIMISYIKKYIWISMSWNKAHNIKWWCSPPASILLMLEFNSTPAPSVHQENHPNVWVMFEDGRVKPVMPSVAMIANWYRGFMRVHVPHHQQCSI